MAVTCTHCGEELLGAVNRCWRCGRSLAVASGDAALPPIRRAPVRLDAVPRPAVPLAAEGLDCPTATRDSELALSGRSRALRANTVLRGSPFADRGDRRAADAELIRGAAAPDSSHHPVPAPARIVHAGRHGAVIVSAALGLGLFGLGLAWRLPLPAILVTVVGLGMGCWGLLGARHRAALAALLLCCLVFAFSLTVGAIRLYQRYHGPFRWDARATVYDEYGAPQ